MTEYSVLMSVYEKEKPEFLKISIESMLNQTVVTNDFVLVCDGPLTGEMNQLIQQYETLYPELFHVFRLNQNGGLGKALHFGLEKCKNDLVARMDSDDISVPKRCEKQLDLFEIENLDIVSGTIQEFETEPEEQGKQRVLPENQEEIRRYSKRRNPFNHPTVMFRKSKVEQCGSYQDVPGFEDYDLWLRMLQNGAKGRNLNEILVYMRTGAGMYERRGGWEYTRRALRFRRRIYKAHYISWKDYVVTAGGQLVVTIMPGKVRRYIYEKILRKG